MITLRNDFHNTEISLRLAPMQPGERREISKSTVRRIERELCGAESCQCSAYGVREKAHSVVFDPNAGDDRRGRYYIYCDY